MSPQEDDDPMKPIHPPAKLPIADIKIGARHRNLRQALRAHEVKVKAAVTAATTTAPAGEQGGAVR